MNLREHMIIPPSIRIEVSVAGHPDLTRVIEVPRRAPAHWVLDALRLSFGVEGDDDEYEDAEDEGPTFLDLDYWDPQVQEIELVGAPPGMTMKVKGLFSPEVGDARVSLVDSQVLEPPASTAWQTAPPPFRREHVNLELARRFGTVVPQFDDSGIAAPERGIRHSSPIARLARSLSAVRRLALHAHLDEAGVLDATPPGRAERESSTQALRALLGRVGDDGVAQGDAGWMPAALLAEVVESLRWTDAGEVSGIDASAALMTVAREARLVRRLRGRVMVTNRGRSLALGQEHALDDVIDAVRDSGRGQRSWGGQPRDVTLAFLAVADGSARTLADLPDLVAAGRAAFDPSQDRFEAYLESSGGQPFGHTAPAHQPSLMHVLSERLAVLSEPGAFGVISPAMRSIARMALV
ncbi:hypothetical protein [Microbacterium sp. PMB16]|uniref:hypothetical protein n=1 Tax=Microbacterium sp. PMB16 TaxID=3120157 RepID=UPI003F4BBD66